jgi:hypothetical protein
LHPKEGLPEGAQVPQGLDDDVEEAVIVARLVGEASHQLQAGKIVLKTLPGHPPCPGDLPLVSCT